MTNWEEIDVPRGAYIGWGNNAGQNVTGKVLEYAPTGGSDFNSNPCPQLAIELIEDAESYNKAGQCFKHAAGDIIQLTCGQVSLKRAVMAADPNPGDLVKISLEGIVNLQGGNTVKEFGIKIARGAGGQSQQPAARPAQAPAPAAAPAPAPTPAAAPAVTLPPGLPPTITAEVWATLSPEAQAALLVSATAGAQQ